MYFVAYLYPLGYGGAYEKTMSNISLKYYAFFVYLNLLPMFSCTPGISEMCGVIFLFAHRIKYS